MIRSKLLATFVVGSLALAATAGCRSRSDAGTAATSQGSGSTPTSPSVVDDATMGASMSSADANARADEGRLETELRALDARVESTWEAFKAETADGTRELSNEARAKWRTTMADLRTERDELKARVDARGEQATSTAGEKIRTALGATERELNELGERLDAALR